MDEAMNVWGAFSGKEDQTAKRRAADSNGQRFTSKDSEFNDFYCCRARRPDQTACATTVPTKIWN
eukprot:9853355-Lingulodinium_polyedra.AAC.1